MTRKLSDEEFDRIEAKRIKKDPSYRSARPGRQAQQAMIERNIREHMFGHNTDLTKSREGKKTDDQLYQCVKTAMLRATVADASNLSQSGPYAVQATPQNPIKVTDKKGRVQYIDDGKSCKNPFNTTAASVPSTLNTFQLKTPEERSKMSFAQAASIPASEHHAQVGPTSAVPSSHDLQENFTVHTKPQTFAAALHTSNPIIFSNSTPADSPKAKSGQINAQAPQIRVINATGPALELGL